MRQSHIIFNLFATVIVSASWFGIVSVWKMTHEVSAVDPVVARIPEIPRVTPTVVITKTVVPPTTLPTVIGTTEATTSTNFPVEMNLSVPFTSQAPEKNWDEPWQNACEEAAVLMVDAYAKGYNVSPLFAKDEILKMVAWEEENNFGTSIDYEKVKQLFLFYSGKNFSIKVIEDPNIEQIKNFISEKKPVLVLADGKVLPNPHFQSGGPVYHALVIRGFTKDSFITNDPGTQFGENFVYKYDDLMNAIRDWNGGNVKNGKKVVLVVE